MPVWPVAPVGYTPPDPGTGIAATVWPPGYSAWLAIGFAVGGEAALYALTPLLGLAALLAWLAGWTRPAFAMAGFVKRQAQHDGWRVPEWVLHGLALIGGVIGAWAGRAVFRHKTQKPVFTVVLVVASILWGVIAAWALLG